MANFFVLMHFAGQKKKSIGLTQAVFSETKKIKVEPLVRQAKKYRWCYTIGAKKNKINISERQQINQLVIPLNLIECYCWISKSKNYIYIY